MKFFIVILNFKHKYFLRTSIYKSISDPKLFKQQLLSWSKQFREIIFLDSNDYPQDYSNYDCLFAVDAFTSIKTDYHNAFEDLNLEAIDPRAWFKSAKGVSAAAIANTTPVAPIITVSREDSRFIDAYEVADQLDDSVNLAAIDWKDFENLIREIFEKEFSSNGGEVKITQASRDGGVDAVAFDPDPIRGGKIVIQAKRYTNVVGVSAVRDLYGTVMNEGATKGILVTTSNYGNDAYKFAQGKPLTLMNGANLLYLLERHGYKAKIDLKEARQQQNN